jgi:vancomycin permeability regulator SanA
MDRRMQAALALYHAGVAPTLLLSGGGHPIPEAEAMRRLALAGGVPESALLVEPTSRNTLENATHAVGLLAKRPGTAVVLVTDRYHALRAHVVPPGRIDCACRACRPLPPQRHLTMLLTETIKLPISLVRALLHKAARAMRG